MMDPELRSLALATELQVSAQAHEDAQARAEAVGWDDGMVAPGAPSTACVMSVSRGSELEDTGSVFQAHLAPCTTPDEARAALHQITADERCRRASCLPYAYTMPTD